MARTAHTAATSWGLAIGTGPAVVHVTSIAHDEILLLNNAASDTAAMRVSRAALGPGGIGLFIDFRSADDIYIRSDKGTATLILDTGV